MASSDIAMQNIMANHPDCETAPPNGGEQLPAYQFRKLADGENPAAQNNEAVDVERNEHNPNEQNPEPGAEGLRLGACCHGCTCGPNWLAYIIWFCIVLCFAGYGVYGWTTMSSGVCEKLKREWIYVSAMVVGLSGVCFLLKEFKRIVIRPSSPLAYKNRKERHFYEMLAMLMAGSIIVMILWIGPSFTLNMGPCKLPAGVSVISRYTYLDWANSTVMLTNGTTNTTALVMQN